MAIEAQEATGIPPPASWYLFAPSRAVGARPAGRRVAGVPMVAFRTENGRVAVLDAACAHLGGDLARGTVDGDRLRCPLHSFGYRTDGQCDIPGARGQISYPVEERHGFVFVFRGREALFPFPDFEAPEAKDRAISMFRFDIDMPWFMVGANAFDVRHFGGSHDRVLLGAPVLDAPSPFARRITSSFRVAGTALEDRLTRAFCGSEVTYTITCWSGNVVLVEAAFERDRTFGYVVSEPREDGRVEVVVLAGAERGRGLLPAALRAKLKSLAIQRMMREDSRRLEGLRLRDGLLSPVDDPLVQYLEWIASLSKVPVLARRTA